MWNNILRGLGQEKDKLPGAPMLPTVPKPEELPLKPAVSIHPNLMSWAKATALKKLRGF